MGTGPDESIVAEIATNIGRDYLSVNAIAIYEKLRLALASSRC
jgi:hypothetical protein